MFETLYLFLEATTSAVSTLKKAPPYGTRIIHTRAWCHIFAARNKPGQHKRHTYTVPFCPLSEWSLGYSEYNQTALTFAERVVLVPFLRPTNADNEFTYIQDVRSTKTELHEHCMCSWPPFTMAGSYDAFSVRVQIWNFSLQYTKIAPASACIPFKI